MPERRAWRPARPTRAVARRSVAPVWVVAAAALSGACAVPIVTDVAAEDAERAAAALEARGVAVERVPGPDGLATLRVPADDVPEAVATLREDAVPRPGAPGLLAALGTDALVPSRTSEHARLLAATAAELERTLAVVPGVVSARVHLAAPAHDALEPDSREAPPTASVLVVHRGTAPPIAEAEVRRLVAHAVPHLDAARVTVVSSRAPDRPPRASAVALGPVSTTPETARRVRVAIAALATLNIALVAVLALAWTRLRRARAAAAALPEEAAR